jgi:hypothetical protein
VPVWQAMKQLFRGLGALLVAGALALSPSSSTAASAVMLTRAQLVQQSDFVVRARAVEAFSAWSGDGSVILTRTRLQVQGFLKGKGPRDLWLEQYGGTVDDKSMDVPGDARIEPGQDLVLFLRKGDDGVVYLTALSQAAYHVQGDKVARDMAGLVLFLKVKGKLTPIEHKPEPREPLAKLLQDIARFVRSR